MTEKTTTEPNDDREPLVLDGNPPEPKPTRFLGKSASIKIDAEVAEALRVIEDGIRSNVPGVTLTAADLFRHAASVAARVYGDDEGGSE